MLTSMISVSAVHVVTMLTVYIVPCMGRRVSNQWPRLASQTVSALGDARLIVHVVSLIGPIVRMVIIEYFAALYFSD